MWCSSCKNNFVGADNLQKWSQKEFDLNTYVYTVSGPSFVYSFDFLRIWNIKYSELITYMKKN